MSCFLSELMTSKICNHLYIWSVKLLLYCQAKMWCKLEGSSWISICVWHFIWSDDWHVEYSTCLQVPLPVFRRNSLKDLRHFFILYMSAQLDFANEELQKGAVHAAEGLVQGLRPSSHPCINSQKRWFNSESTGLPVCNLARTLVNMTSVLFKESLYRFLGIPLSWCTVESWLYGLILGRSWSFTLVTCPTWHSCVFNSMASMHVTSTHSWTPKLVIMILQWLKDFVDAELVESLKEWKVIKIGNPWLWNVQE